MARAKHNKKMRHRSGGESGGAKRHHGRRPQRKLLPGRQKVKGSTGRKAESGQKVAKKGKAGATKQGAKKGTKKAPSRAPVRRRSAPKAKTAKRSQPAKTRAQRRVAVPAQPSKVQPKQKRPPQQKPRGEAPRRRPKRVTRPRKTEPAKRRKRPVKVKGDISFGGPGKTHDARPGVVKVALGLVPNPESMRKNYVINKGKPIFTYYHKAANLGYAEANLLRIYEDVAPSIGEPMRLIVRIRQDDGINFEKFRAAVRHNVEAAEVAGLVAKARSTRNADGSFDAEIKIDPPEHYPIDEEGAFGELVRQFADVADIPTNIT